ncbi:myosin heavy chain, muscle-like [Vespula pensylvanica]|uniref:myosin heavy chain, muscle-like n=1 Tax=Vespula pensylvanica TaxID=30213 RepID=UPI001CB9DFF9|nr:myosin heavy chain, muscle-like [Vespula pensylvanica]
MLENVELEVTGIIEDLEEPTTGVMTIPQTKLSIALEEFCKTISTVRTELSDRDKRVVPGYDEGPLSIINHLLKPLTMIEEALDSTEELDVAELSILNRLERPLEDTERYVLLPSLEISGNDRSRENFEQLVRVLDATKARIPIAMKEVSSRKEILGYLRDISKPLESIQEQMRGLETIPEETLEKDVARILVGPIDSLLRVVNASSQQTRILDRRKEVIKEMRRMTGPLVEFLSCLSVVKSSRKSLVPEATLLDERKNVILKAVEELRLEICDILEKIATVEDGGFIEESLISLNDAILSVRNQVERADYTPRPSSASIRFQNYFMGSLNRLGETIDDLEKGTEESPQKIIAKSLEPLKKQISLSRSQFSQTSDQFVDEEVIVEGFLYPTNQLRSALSALKESIERSDVTAPFTSTSLGSLENLADAIADLAHSLSSHRAGLIDEGVSEGSSIVETFSAALEVLENVKTSITSIRDMTLGKRTTERKVESTDEGHQEESFGTEARLGADESTLEGDTIIPARTEDQPATSERFGLTTRKEKDEDEGKEKVGDKFEDLDGSTAEEREKAREEDVGNESRGTTGMPLVSLPDEEIEREMSRQRLGAKEREETAIDEAIDESVKENDRSGAKSKLEEQIEEKLETTATREDVKDENRSTAGAREEKNHETTLEGGITERKTENAVERGTTKVDDSGEIQTIEKIPNEGDKTCEEIPSEISKMSAESKKHSEDRDPKSMPTETVVTVIETVVVDEIVRVSKEEVESEKIR